jgi:uncharacterized protein involved in exopolysaccharide biosynthesis
MNLQRIQSVPLQQFRSEDSASGAPSSPVDNSLPSAGSEQPFFRLDLLRSLQLHRKLALGIALSGVALAAAYAAMMWPVYTAQSQVYIQPIQPKILEQGSTSHWPTDATTYDSFIGQQVQNASHPEVLAGVLHKLEPGSWQKKGESEQTAVERLGKSIQVARVGTSYQVAITAKAADPVLSAKIANAMAAGIVERSSSEDKAGDAERLAILRDEQDRIQKELSADRAEQESLNTKLGVAAIGTTTPDHYDDDISKTHEELVKARTAHDEATARLISLGGDHGLSSKSLDAEADEIVTSDPGLISMKTSLNQRRAVLITQMANLTPNHPQYKQASQELTQIDASLESMMKDMRAKAAVRIQQRVRTDLDRTAGVEGRLNAQLGKLTGAAASATSKLQRANDLATDIVRLQTRHAAVDEQLHNLMLEDSVPGAAHLSVAATVPQHPTISGILRKTLPIALGGILLGLMAALLASNLDPKVYIATDIEHALGFAPMAQLPDFSEVSDGVADEHLLRISAMIAHANQQGTLKSCLFTGTSSGVGVSTVSTRVKTLLETIGSPAVLINESGMPMPVQRTGSAEAGPQDSAGKLAIRRGIRSVALQQRSEGAAEEESLVITDTAPLLISAETEYLARNVDAVIVLVESGVTTRTQLREVATNLQRLNVAAMGFILNRIELKKADPSFRRSVRAMEKHLRAQSRSIGRRTERNVPSTSVVSPDAEPSLAEHAENELQSPVAPEQFVKANTVPEATAEPVAIPVPAVAPAPRRVVKMPQREEFVAAAPVVPPVAMSPKPAAERAPRILRTDVTRSAAFEQTADERELFETSVSHPGPTKPKAQPAVPPPPARSQSAMPQRREQVPDSSGKAAEKAVAADRVSQSDLEEHEEHENNASSSQSERRNLAFAAALKNLRKRAETEETATEASSLPVQEAERQPSARVFVQEPIPVRAAPTANVSDNESSTLVTAPPEFLPPKPATEKDEKGASRSGRLDRKDTYDEVPILPSWHGQYRR